MIVLLLALIGSGPGPNDYYSGYNTATVTPPVAPVAPVDAVTRAEFEQALGDLNSKLDAVLNKLSSSTPPPKEIEDDEPIQPVNLVPRNRVVVYVDLSDSESLRRMLSEFQVIRGLDFVPKDRRDVPAIAAELQLPVFHFAVGSGKWGFRSGWHGPTEFVSYWTKHNQDQAKTVSVGASEGVHQNPQRSVSGHPVGTVTVDVWEHGCPACTQLKSDVRDYTGLTFVFRNVNTPAPVLRWKVGNVTWTLDGWTGLAEFIAMYNATLPAKSSSQADPGHSPTPIAEVRRVLNLLRPQSTETFVDYGCGDGRWLVEAARTFRCRAVGVEIDPDQAAKARQAVADAGLTDMIEIIEGDALAVNVEAQVGVAYLYPDLLARLKPKLLKLDRFATYMHPVDGVAMKQSGDAWIWEKSVPMPATVQQPMRSQKRYAWYGGQAYSGRVCNNPRCSMCNAIARQLGM